MPWCMAIFGNSVNGWYGDDYSSLSRSSMVGSSLDRIECSRSSVSYDCWMICRQCHDMRLLFLEKEDSRSDDAVE